jgi:hypothetical protein
MNKDSISHEYGVSGVQDDIFIPALIISGGQTGADIGGLRGARACGIATGGVAPKGWRTEYGRNPELADFGLIEHESDNYPPRTRANIEMSEATLLIAHNFDSRGSRTTEELTRELGKPLCKLHYGFWRKVDSEEQFHDARLWLAQIKPVVLNVAGNRESVARGIEGWTIEAMKRLFLLSK